jgi:hypothetical protein
VTPAALAKAESLARYAKHQGSPLHEFALAITLGEAYELLDYLTEIHDNALLRHEVAQAKVNCDPWGVLANFQLLGFEIVPVSELH